MCGISGFNWQDKELGTKMNRCLSHRGPDAEGIFEAEGITLSHRRLAIIDLSEAANQPMHDTSGDLVIVFNGEIYNYKELKSEMQDYTFATESDTEVILAGFKKWGHEVVHKLNGIFAFAIWDKKEKSLFIARDHLGVKPLYYYWDGDRFIFSSEVKAILEHPIPRLLNIASFNEYLRVLYVPEPHTMIQHIYKLPPASYMVLKGKELVVHSYWKPTLRPMHSTYREAQERVREEISKAVSRQMVADVPVGVYLSGGFDSSIVLSEAVKRNNHINTFSIGFDLEEDEDREKFNRDFNLAKETAAYFGTTHHPFTMSLKDVRDNIEKIISSIDDPISNPTALPMALLSVFAKKEVTVVLSGNGGDELFGGYERYRMGRRIDIVGNIPGIKYLFPGRIRTAYEMNALDRLVQFEFEKDKRLYRVIQPAYFEASDKVKQGFERYIHSSLDKTESLMMADVQSWLPDQALILGDKMSMFGSIEERVPLLDREVVATAFSLPLSYKVSPLSTKKILKDSYKEILPEALYKEPKRGWFSPGAKWIRRNEILALFREVLSSSYYRSTSPLFNWSEIEIMLEAHVSKKEYNLTVLWALFTFQVWAKAYNIEV